MNYDRLEPEYLKTQTSRIVDILDKMQEREQSVSRGTQVPNDGTLALGTGKVLSMAVVFMDICGFSKRFSETKEEQQIILDAFNLLFTEMIRIAEDYGGTVEKNTGDGLMAYFEDSTGDPPETGIKRALGASLTMLYANENLISPIMSRSGVDPFKFRMAIEYGPVTVAEVGAARRFRSRVAIGTVANIASKALRFAEPGEIVLGYRAYAALPPRRTQEFAQLIPADSGWIFRASGKTYPFYRYTGRWRHPS